MLCESQGWAFPRYSCLWVIHAPVKSLPSMLLKWPKCNHSDLEFERIESQFSYLGLLSCPLSKNGLCRQWRVKKQMRNFVFTHNSSKGKEETWMELETETLDGSRILTGAAGIKTECSWQSTDPHIASLQKQVTNEKRRSRWPPDSSSSQRLGEYPCLQIKQQILEVRAGSRKS